MLKIEKECLDHNINIIAGIDEAGRGPLAGPVVACCVTFENTVVIQGINDSKKLTPKKRDLLYDEIYDKAKEVSVGIVHEDKIDEINILQAAYLAMKIALGNMKIKPDLVLIDGPSSNIKHYNVKHIIGGDSKSQSIAAASIIAKVTRDRMMEQYDLIYPDYKFAKHKGYGTKYHIDTIKTLKSSPIHRKSFKIVKSNLPSFNYIKNSYGFKELAKMIVASYYVKKEFKILNNAYNVDQNNSFDYIVKKEHNCYFIKVHTNDITTNISLNDNLYSDNCKFIKTFILEKDLETNFTFIVISVMFQKNKKPLIKLIYKKELNSD